MRDNYIILIKRILAVLIILLYSFVILNYGYNRNLDSYQHVLYSQLNYVIKGFLFVLANISTLALSVYLAISD